MSSNKYLDRVSAVILAITLIATILFMNGTALGITAVADEDAETYTGNEYFTDNDLNGEWSSLQLTEITLSGDSASIKGNGAYFDNGSLTIKNGGYYDITGELTDGSIVVDTYSSSKVWIRLNGVSVTRSDDAAMIITTADKVFLTLADGSSNSFVSGETFSEEAESAKRNAAIYSKEDLTINGSGSLQVTAGYKHGIKCNDTLVIAGGTISVTSPGDGLHANDAINITNTDLTIDSGDDAVHCDASIYYQDGTLNITECYEGIEGTQVEIAGGDIVIHASDDGINAGGGSSDTFGGMGMMRGFEQQGNAASDGNGEESEENSSPTVRITGGNITIINENGRDADGIDSNGDIIIEGGKILVSLTAGGGNNALDYGSENGGELLINGGSVLAAGSSSMLEGVSDNSMQCSVVIVPEETVAENSVVSVKDEAGNVVMEETLPCSIGAVVISDPAFTKGETYTVSFGEDEVQTVTFEETVASEGTASGGMGMGGMGFPGAESITESELEEMRENHSRGGQAPNERGQGMMNQGAGAEETEQAENAFHAYDAETWIMLGISVLVLVAGLAFAVFYKRRG